MGGINIIKENHGAVTTVASDWVGVDSNSNLLINSAFFDTNADNLPDFWALSGTPTLAITADTLFPALGGNQVTITATGANLEGMVITRSATNWLKVKPSTTYTFSFDYKVTAGDKLAVTIASSNAGTIGTNHVQDSTTLTSVTAIRNSYTFTTDANANNLTIYFRANLDGDIVIVSHPKLEEGSIATPYVGVPIINTNGYTKLLVYYHASTGWDRAGNIIVLGSGYSGGTFVVADDTVENYTFGVAATDDTVFTGGGQFYVVEATTPYIKIIWRYTTIGTTGGITIAVVPFND